MKLSGFVSSIGAALSLLVSTTAMAETTRSASSLPVAGKMLTVPASARSSRPTAEQNSLLGAPLFLIFLGAVAVTIGTIVIVNNNDSRG